MSKTEQLEWLLKDQFTKRDSLVVNVEGVWIVGISGASFEWARQLCQVSTHASRWNLITDVTIPDADVIFNSVLVLDDLVNYLWHEFLSKTVLYPSIAAWMKDYETTGSLIIFLCQHYEYNELLKQALTNIPITLVQKIAEEMESVSDEAIQYVSSSSASFFHTATCQSTKRITSPVYYASIDEAEEAGKKPCSVCKPNGAE